MGIEYTFWAKSAVWIGEIDETVYPPQRLSPYLAGLMAEEPSTAPPYLGTVRKEFDDVLTGFFFDFDNKLLSPDNARSVATWLRQWADSAMTPIDEVVGAYKCADWLTNAANTGWFVDWSV